MNICGAATTVLAVVVALMLGMGSASAGDHVKSSVPITRQAATAAGPGSAAAGAGDVDFLTGYPREVHTDERMIEEELELAGAAPHTLWRFDAGSV